MEYVVAGTAGFVGGLIIGEVLTLMTQTIKKIGKWISGIIGTITSGAGYFIKKNW